MPPAGNFLVSARKLPKNRLGEALTVQPISMRLWSLPIYPGFKPSSPRPLPAPGRYTVGRLFCRGRVPSCRCEGIYAHGNLKKAE